MDEDEYEGPQFVGFCTCPHDPDDHGWGKCDVEGCSCEAGWED